MVTITTIGRKYITVKEGYRKLRFNRAVWERCQAYMREKGKLWDTYISLPADDPRWENWNADRAAISNSYRDIFSTREYRFMLQGAVEESLREMSGLE